MMSLYTMMIDKDATMVEINPMVEVEDSPGKRRGNTALCITIFIVAFQTTVPCCIGTILMCVSTEPLNALEVSSQVPL